MKKPIAVVVAIVVFSFLTITSVIPFLVSTVQDAFVGLPISLIGIILHVVGVIGLLQRASWARLYSIFILSLWSIALLILGYFASEQMKDISAFTICLLVSALLLRLAYSFWKSIDTRQYFRQSKSAPESFEKIR